MVLPDFIEKRLVHVSEFEDSKTQDYKDCAVYMIPIMICTTPYIFVPCSYFCFAPFYRIHMYDL